MQVTVEIDHAGAQSAPCSNGTILSGSGRKALVCREAFGKVVNGRTGWIRVVTAPDRRSLPATAHALNSVGERRERREGNADETQGCSVGDRRSAADGDHFPGPGWLPGSPDHHQQWLRSWRFDRHHSEIIELSPAGSVHEQAPHHIDRGVHDRGRAS